MVLCTSMEPAFQNLRISTKQAEMAATDLTSSCCAGVKTSLLYLPADLKHATSRCAPETPGSGEKPVLSPQCHLCSHSMSCISHPAVPHDSRFILPNGEELEYGSSAEVGEAEAESDNWQGRPALTATVRLLSCAFFRKVITRHDTGMGESYMDGDYEVGSAEWNVRHRPGHAWQIEHMQSPAQSSMVSKERAAPHQAEHTSKAPLVLLQLCAILGGGCDTAGGCSACTMLHHALNLLTIGWACENVSRQLHCGHSAVRCMLCADSSPMHFTLQVSNLGGLLAVATANATSIESNRGMLGWLNWAGDRLLHLAHRTR